MTCQTFYVPTKIGIKDCVTLDNNNLQLYTEWEKNKTHCDVSEVFMPEADTVSVWASERWIGRKT